MTRWIKQVYRGIISMPPVEKRPRINNVLRYFIYMDYDRRYNEAYVYYKTFIVNLWLNSFFLAVYYISFIWKVDINLFLFRIHYRPEAEVDELVYGYPLHVFPIIVIITVLYSMILFLLHTDYLSKDRIIHEKVPVLDSSKRLYEFKPWRFIVVAAFLIGTGITLWSGPHWFRESLFYMHDFNAHTPANFIFFALFYYVLYQTFYCQLLIKAAVGLSRSVLRHCVYRKEIDHNLKEENNADDQRNL